jgi:hypothetical protein
MQVIINGTENYVAIIGTTPYQRVYWGRNGRSGKIYTKQDSNIISMQIGEDWYELPWEELIVNGTSPTSYINAWELLTAVTSTNPPPLPVLTIGQQYQGGIIYYIDGSGQHGLIRALDADISVDSYVYQFSNGAFGFALTGATGYNIGTGLSNTNILLSNPSFSAQAADICNSFNAGGYTDWYLPSAEELVKMNNNGQFPASIFTGGWTSTEVSIDTAYVLAPLIDVNPIDASKDVSGIQVIPIRSF